MDKPARKSRREDIDFGLVAANQRLSPEQRLNAFLTHCEFMMELYQAGEEMRRAGRARIKTGASPSGRSDRN